MHCVSIKKLIVASLFCSALIGCVSPEDDGYLPPPVTVLDQKTAFTAAHQQLARATYERVTGETDCGEVCEVFERGFSQARRLRISSPARCTDEFESGLWSQTEYQEGCRAYALKVLSLVDEMKLRHRESAAS
jgi:hypothetical protein